MAEDNDTVIDVAVACRVLGVSRSGYYDWLGRPPSARQEANTLLLKHITDVRTVTPCCWCSQWQARCRNPAQVLARSSGRTSA